jgi:phosphoribosyl 1,2-cyclic phosphate phosphodiesterase
LLVRGGAGERLLVDAGPEFRLQALRAGIDGLDAVFITHAHADHIHGMDDLRPLTMAGPLPVYGNEPTIDEVRSRFDYVFRETQLGGGKPRFDLVVVSNAVKVGKLIAMPIPAKHGRLDILGWLFTEGKRRAAYLTDVSYVGEASRELLRDLDVLIVGALRERPHETHYSFDQALALIEALAPARAFFTHLCHEHSHSDIEILCKERSDRPVSPAYDGLRIDLVSKDAT